MGNIVVRNVSDNLRCPTSNIWGWIVKKKVFLGSNVPVVLAAVKLCDIQPDHNVLEIGFGPGVGLQEAAKYVNDGSGMVYGLDISSAMMIEASKRLSLEIAHKKVDITQGTVTILPYNSDYFDRVFHVNCFYFWDNIHLACTEIYRVMKPNSLMISTLNPRSLHDALNKGFLQNAKPDPIRYMNVLEETGFQNVHAEYHDDGDIQAIIAEVKEKIRPSQYAQDTESETPTQSL